MTCGGGGRKHDQQDERDVSYRKKWHHKCQGRSESEGASVSSWSWMCPKRLDPSWPMCGRADTVGQRRETQTERTVSQKKDQNICLRRQESVPVANLLSGCFPHLLPVDVLLFGGTVESERDPAEKFATFQAALVQHGQQQSHFGQLKQCHLRGQANG